MNMGFSYLHNILRESQEEVEKILVKRRKNGEIKDISQARKSIVGSAFSNLFKLIFLLIKQDGHIRNNIFITSNPSRETYIEEMITIYVGEETQKPDMDIAIYSLDKNKNLDKCFILSLKTSLRERAGQTYKWKLLLEIATSENSIKDKYDISYNNNKMPLVGFATVNFYDEINNPQHRGMFKFFDQSFIGKPIVDSTFITQLSELPDFVNKNL